MSYLVISNKNIPENTLVISKNNKLLRDIVRKLSSKYVVKVENASNFINEIGDELKEVS